MKDAYLCFEYLSEADEYKMLGDCWSRNSQAHESLRRGVAEQAAAVLAISARRDLGTYALWSARSFSYSFDLYSDVALREISAAANAEFESRLPISNVEDMELE